MCKEFESAGRLLGTFLLTTKINWYFINLLYTDDYGENAAPAYDEYAEDYTYENDLNFECVTEDGEQGLVNK